MICLILSSYILTTSLYYKLDNQLYVRCQVLSRNVNKMSKEEERSCPLKRNWLVMCLWHRHGTAGSGGGGVSAQAILPAGFFFPLKAWTGTLSDRTAARSRHALDAGCVSALAAETFTTWLLSSCLTSRCGISSICVVEVLLNWPAHLMEWDILF
jgi:hypothetical protein